MLIRSLAIAAAAALAIAGTAQAKPKPHHVLPDLSKVPKLAAIPPEQLAAFPVFQQPAAKGIPDVVLRSFQDPRLVQLYGMDPRQARAITGQRGGTWYAIPGTKGMCLYVSAAATCTATEQAIGGKLMLYRLPPPPKGELAGGATPDTVVTFLGLAPTGTTSVVVSLTSGATTSLPIGPTGAYRLPAVGPFQKVALTRVGADPLTVTELPAR
jgi:hypothetical protein